MSAVDFILQKSFKFSLKKWLAAACFSLSRMGQCL